MVLRATTVGLVVAAAAATINDTTTHTFLSIGDWGGASIDEHAQATHAVAAALEKVAAATSPQLVVNTGDKRARRVFFFYPSCARVFTRSSKPTGSTPIRRPR